MAYPVLALALFTGSAEAAHLAVLPFSVESPEEEHADLGKGVANMLTTDLEQTGSVTLVERMRLTRLQDELILQQSAWVDPETARNVGRLTGADQVLIGGITVADGRMRIDARIISIETGEVGDTVSASGRSDHFFDVFEKLVRQLAKMLKAPVTTGNERRFAVRNAGSIDGAANYGQAVAAWDEGDVKASRAAVKRAVDDVGHRQAESTFRGDIEPLPRSIVELGWSAFANPETIDFGFDVSLGWAPTTSILVSTRYRRTFARSDSGVDAHGLEAIGRLRFAERNGRSFWVSAGAGPLVTPPLEDLDWGWRAQLGLELLQLQARPAGVTVGLFATHAEYPVDEVTPRATWTGLEARLSVALTGARTP